MVKGGCFIVVLCGGGKFVDGKLLVFIVLWLLDFM